MVNARYRTFLRRWPFWALLIAWVCANGPQSAVYEAVLWMKGATHFSHQAQLTQRVAAMLSGREVPVDAARLAAAPLPVRDSSALPFPEEAVLKKVDLGQLCFQEAWLRWKPASSWPSVAERVPDRAIADVILPPPRGA